MYVSALYNFQHYGTVSAIPDPSCILIFTIIQEYYSSGLSTTCLKCQGQRDLLCSAGNLMYGVTAGHFQSFGITMAAAGCR